MSKGLTIVPDGRSDSVAIVGPSLSDAVKYPIRELMIAFPSPNISAEERTVQLGIYRDAVLGFEEELVVSVAKWMRFHNPRNTPSYTQPPTPQDLHVAIKNRREVLARQSVDYFFGRLGTDNTGRRRWMPVRESSPECSRQLSEVLAVEAYNPDQHDDLVDRMPQEAFGNLPAALFSDESKAMHIEHRAHLEYLRSLDDTTWHIRRAVLLHDRQCRMSLSDYKQAHLTEQTLMEKVTDLVAEFNRPVHLHEGDMVREHRIGEFLREKNIFVSNDHRLWQYDLRCVPISVLRGEKEPGPIAEVVSLTARMLGEKD